MAEKKQGRPTKFNVSLQQKILELAKEGKTNEQIAEFIGISVQTLRNWRGKNQDFMLALKSAKGVADELVEASLFQRAIGYSHKAVKIMSHEGDSWEHEYTERYPPDTTAAIFWLKNRKPDEWRDKTEIDVTKTENVTFKIGWADEDENGQLNPPEKDATPTEDPEKPKEIQESGVGPAKREDD